MYQIKPAVIPFSLENGMALHTMTLLIVEALWDLTWAGRNYIIFRKKNTNISHPLLQLHLRIA